jgi:hypothetical protein
MAFEVSVLVVFLPKRLVANGCWALTHTPTRDHSPLLPHTFWFLIHVESYFEVVKLRVPGSQLNDTQRPVQSDGGLLLDVAS